MNSIKQAMYLSTEIYGRQTVVVFEYKKLNEYHIICVLSKNVINSYKFVDMLSYNNYIMTIFFQDF